MLHLIDFPNRLVSFHFRQNPGWFVILAVVFGIVLLLGLVAFTLLAPGVAARIFKWVGEQTGEFLGNLLNVDPATAFIVVGGFALGGALVWRGLR